MAAYPLPDNNPPVYIANAATATSITVIPGQSIDWENQTSAPIPINVQAVNGVYPLTQNSFSVPAAHISVGSVINAVLATTPLGEYPFTRGATEGGGKIIVQANLGPRSNR
ncbi:MAG TPA: hypothetical protein VNW47_04885 [Terriglobales bacterium]|jgi:hypothetical protein|nr:hypothetical protein [Terriglobales bacterium]